MRSLCIIFLILFFNSIGSQAQTMEIEGTSIFHRKIKVGDRGYFMKNLQGGTLLFGPDDSEWDELDEIEGLAKFTYTFFSPFSTVPHIIATARHPANTNFSDVFSVTIQSVSTTSVTFLVKRVDSEGGWGMNLHVDWWGFEL